VVHRLIAAIQGVMASHHDPALEHGLTVVTRNPWTGET
jgi:hypothetical protein